MVIIYMRTSNKTLFIFYYFGGGYAAGLQNERLIAGLERQKVNYEIIYRFSKGNANHKATRVDTPKFSRLNAILHRIHPGLISALKVDEIVWTIVVFFKIKNRCNEFDSIHITSSPFFVQLIGKYFKSKCRVKWVVQLLDPILDNYYHNNYRISRQILGMLERAIILKADLIITNSSRLGAILMNRYSLERSKLAIIPPITIYDTITSSITNEQLTIVHSGGIYGLRNLDYLIKAIKIHNDKYDRQESFKVELIGHCSEKETDKISSNKLEKQIKLIGYLKSEELYSKLACADVFLVIDAMNHEGVFFPTKLCEYFSFKKMIIGITPKEGVTADLLSEAKHKYFTPGEEEKLADFLNTLYQDRSYCNDFDRGFYRRYLPDTVVMNYLDAMACIGLNRVL